MLINLFLSWMDIHAYEQQIVIVSTFVVHMQKKHPPKNWQSLNILQNTNKQWSTPRYNGYGNVE